MKDNNRKIYTWVTLPIVFSSITIVASQVNTSHQQESSVQQVSTLNLSTLNYSYVDAMVCTNSSVSYRYNFGGDSVFQPDKRYRRIHVEAPKSQPAHEKQAVYPKKSQ